MRLRAKRSQRTSDFPIRDRFNVLGHVVGEVCFACRCRVVEFVGDQRIVFAWCECDWPEDAAEMEVL